MLAQTQKITRLFKHLAGSLSCDVLLVADYARRIPCFGVRPILFGNGGVRPTLTPAFLANSGGVGTSLVPGTPLTPEYDGPGSWDRSTQFAHAVADTLKFAGKRAPTQESAGA